MNEASASVSAKTTDEKEKKKKNKRKQPKAGRENGGGLVMALIKTLEKNQGCL